MFSWRVEFEIYWLFVVVIFRVGFERRERDILSFWREREGRRIILALWPTMKDSLW
jgi:hypothetical protein